MIGEYATRRSQGDMLSGSHGYMGTLGHQFGKLLVAGTYASEFGVKSSVLFHALDPGAATFSPTVFFNSSRSQYVNLRYDFTDSFCAKIQLQRHEMLYSNPQWNDVITAWGAGVDLVF